jgi:hypothetical protein
MPWCWYWEKGWSSFKVFSRAFLWMSVESTYLM